MRRRKAGDKVHAQLCHEAYELMIGAEYIKDDAIIAKNWTRDPRTKAVLTKHARMLSQIEREAKTLLSKHGCKRGIGYDL